MSSMRSAVRLVVPLGVLAALVAFLPEATGGC
jgi:hypothetical protein